MLPLTVMRSIPPAIRRHVPLQVALVAGLWGLGELLVRMTRLPLPGGLVGLIVLLGLLASRRVDARLVTRGAHWLIGEMLLFFVPAAPLAATRGLAEEEERAAEEAERNATAVATVAAIVVAAAAEKQQQQQQKRSG